MAGRQQGRVYAVNPASRTGGDKGGNLSYLSPMYNVSPFLFEALEDLLAEAKKAGASAADAVAAQSTSLSASMRGGKLSDLERSEAMEVSLRVLVGKQQASLATSDIKRDTFRELAERAVATARLAPEDPYV